MNFGQGAQRPELVHEFKNDELGKQTIYHTLQGKDRYCNLVFLYNFRYVFIFASPRPKINENN